MGCEEMPGYCQCLTSSVFDSCSQVCPNIVPKVGQYHTYIRIHGVHTVFLAEKLPYIRSYTVCIYGSDRPYLF